MNDWVFGTIAEMGAGLRAREVTAVGLAEQALARMRTLDGRLHAFIEVTAERALAQARAADALLQSGVDLGPLHGVPYAVKDLYDVAGLATTAGTSLLSENI